MVLYKQFIYIHLVALSIPQALYICQFLKNFLFVNLFIVLMRLIYYSAIFGVTQLSTFHEHFHRNSTHHFQASPALVEYLAHNTIV